MSSRLLFSIIIPLAFHRGKWKNCLRAWCHDQTLSKSRYEVIAVVPPDFPRSALNALSELLGPYGRLQHSRARHDMPSASKAPWFHALGICFSPNLIVG